MLARAIGLEHALASQRLYTDGAEVLFDYATQRDDRDVLELVAPRTGHHQVSELGRDCLQRITYGHDGWAANVRLPSTAAPVIVDPEVAFGLPIVTAGGARVEDLVDRLLAGDTITDAAEDFAVPVAQVEEVIRVATRLAA